MQKWSIIKSFTGIQFDDFQYFGELFVAATDDACPYPTNRIITFYSETSYAIPANHHQGTEIHERNESHILLRTPHINNVTKSFFNNTAHAHIRIQAQAEELLSKYGTAEMECNRILKKHMFFSVDSNLIAERIKHEIFNVHKLSKIFYNIGDGNELHHQQSYT